MEQTWECVEQMLDAGVGLEEIEAFIDGRSHLPGDEQSALWLLAWAEDNRRRRAARRVVHGPGWTRAAWR